MAAKVAPGVYRCPDCGEDKPREDFYSPPTKSTEVSHYCKPCHRRRARQNRERGG